MPLDPSAVFVSCRCTRTIVEIGKSREYRNMWHSETECRDLPVNRKRTMEFTTYIRKPFEVKVVEITRDNIEEVARSVGDVRHRDDGTPYILVDRRLVPSVERVHIGFFMTKIGDNVRCYSPRVFREQFVEKTPEIQPWLDFLAGKEPQKDVADAPA